MDFEEKMDAIRMNLELAPHDIESLRESMRELRDASASQYWNIQVLMKTSGISWRRRKATSEEYRDWSAERNP